MIKLAIFKLPIYKINLIEIKKKIVYTINTLKLLRLKLGQKKSIIFIIGEDNLINITNWNQWKKLLNFCHLIICPRKKIHEIKNMNDKSLKLWIDNHKTNNINLLHQYPHGFIFFTNINYINISSTKIRNSYRKGKSCISMLPKNVEQYIKINHLYT